MWWVWALLLQYVSATDDDVDGDVDDDDVDVDDDDDIDKEEESCGGCGQSATDDDDDLVGDVDDVDDDNDDVNDVDDDVNDGDDDNIDKEEESCGGCGHKPTAVKSWQVPPLSSPPACHHLFVFLQFHILYLFVFSQLLICICSDFFCVLVVSLVAPTCLYFF